MKGRIGRMALRSHARELSILLGKGNEEDILHQDLHRFVNTYRIGIEEARRAVMVLHGIPPGLTGPARRKYTWQSGLERFATID